MDDFDDVGSDIRSALTTIQETSNDQRLPALREEQREERLPATREEPREERALARKEQVPANREQDEEDERLHEDELDAQEQPQQRRELSTQRRQAAPSVDKAPVAWRGPLKEEWAKLPEPVRKEINRREREIAQTLSRTDTERRYANEIYNAIQPFEAHIRAEGVTHVQAVEHLFQMAHVMRTANVATKADLIAELFFRHDVPIKAVDDALTRRLQAGGRPPADPVRQAVQQELQPIKEFMAQQQTTQQAVRQQATQQTQAQAQAGIQELLDDPLMGDLVDDVRDDIADLLDLASSRGRVLSLQDAARRAIMAHAEVGPIYQQRQLEQQAQQQRGRVAKAKRAGASLQDDGAPSTASDEDDGDGSLGADLRASIRTLSRASR